MPGRPTSPRAKQREPLPGFATATARIAHRFAPRVAPAHPPQTQRGDAAMRPAASFVASPRMLIGALIVLALLPNLSLAAYLWLPAFHANEPTVPPNSAALADLASDGDARPAEPVRPAEPTKARPVLSAPATLEASASGDIPLPIELDGTDGLPARSVIAISGLPEGATLSNGRPYGANGWNLKYDEIGDLQLHLGGPLNSETRIAIELVEPQGEILASAETVLSVDATPQVAPDPPAMPAVADGGGEQNPTPAPVAVKTEPITPPPVTADADGGQAPKTAIAAAEPIPAGTEDAGVSDSAPAPSGAPKPMTLASPDAAADASGSGVIEPAMYVNMRKDANSSSAVLGVVPKGTKLAVLDRKRGWVQVSYPAVADKGWIYAGNLAGSSKRLRRSAKAADDEASIWSRMGDWLGGSPSSSDTQAH